MADFVPPPGPPPPKVPEGWKAVYSDQYKEWFYVNLYTKQSTWERPTEPARPPNSSHEDAPPGVPPPSYSAGPDVPHVSDTKQPLESNNPYSSQRRANETDEQLARRLQEEENLRDRGAADDYYNSGTAPGAAGAGAGARVGTGTPGIQGGYPGAPSPLPARPESSNSAGRSKGFFGKLLGKTSSSSHGYPAQHGGYGYGQPGYPQAGYGAGPGYGGGYPQQGYGGYPPGPVYGGGYGGGYGAAAPPRRSGGGMGVGGAAALGVGGGLLGGMLLSDAINDGEQDAYQDGYQDGADNGGDYGGGDDMGGGDF
ncbi:hypothetical protein A1O1_01756 [Capronia coronata CBS 617.96]|uniref:WW domain-containing protein n=1 Tax=Capronia coronata CBS 617.96 TaxID=1182541 RepID=W9ZFV7_9EURO|nr:uncharacterized protein A1O1_01756 [Capronia coronata CBS 617.96]EXJ93364.1 hypothetical protein A1O1_01756 [Capronia coronata CBS 617.96]